MDDDTTHYVYVLASNPDGPVKIGISNDPDRRVRQLQTGHAEPLRVLHREPVGDAARAKAFETLIHRNVAHLRRRGEWFAMSGEQAVKQVLFAVMTYDDIDDLPGKVRRRLV